MEYFDKTRIWKTMKMTFAAKMYCAMETILCSTDMNLDLTSIEWLVEFINFSKKLCPAIYAIDTMKKIIMPLGEVLKSIKKFATVASTFAKIRAESRPNINTVNRRLDLIK